MSQFRLFGNNSIETTRIFLDDFEFPILLMQSDPRQVVSANKKVCDMFDKDLSQIEAQRGGQVFDCIHSFTEQGCGKDAHCEDCIIKNAVVHTHTTGEPKTSVMTIMDTKKQDKIAPYEIRISTHKIGNYSAITVHKYKEIF